jgi:PPP family 3-phenylpropionic acid transporter
MQLGHGPYYGFFTLYLSEHGYDNGFIGMLWSVGVIAEVLLFIVMHRMLFKFSLRILLLASLLLTALRWAMTALWVDYPWLLMAIQILHAASFGVFHAVAIQWMHLRFSSQTAGQAQALYSALSFGAGGALGIALSGYAWTAIGGQWVFGVAALLMGFALVIAWRGFLEPVAIEGK